MTETKTDTAKMLGLARDIAGVLDEKKGEDVLIMDLTRVADFTDYFVICTGGSIRTINSLKQEIQTNVKQSYERTAMNVEGDAASGWILMDYGDVIVHIFTKPMREFYQLEEFWSEAKIILHLR